MTFGEPHESDAQRTELNSRAIERTNDAAEILRNQVIDLGFDAVKKFLQDDMDQTAELEENEYPEGVQVEVYILTDLLSAPRKDGEFTQTLSLLLARDEEIAPTHVDLDDNYPHSNDSQLRLYIPVPDDYRLGEDEIPTPEEVYVERVLDGEDSRSRYVIRRDGMYEYESAKDSGEEIIYDDFSDKVLWRRMTRRVVSDLPILAVISEDLINMTAVPQRVITIGKPEVQDR